MALKIFIHALVIRKRDDIFLIENSDDAYIIA